MLQAGHAVRERNESRGELAIPLRALRRLLVAMIVTLTLLSVSWQIAYSLLQWDWMGSPTRYFDLNRERNLPTWCQGLTLMACAILLWGIGSTVAAAGGRWSLHWRGLGLVFVYLSLDELFKWHERTIEPLRAWLGLSDHAAGGLLLYAWVIPGIALVILLGLLFLRFYLSLPRDTQWRFAIAAALLVSGAIGMEIASGRVQVLYDWGSLPYVAVSHVEEIMEMSGQCLFLLALATHSHRHLGGPLRYGRLRLAFRPPSIDETRAPKP